MNREEEHTLKKLFGTNGTLDINRGFQKVVQDTFRYRSRKAEEDKAVLFLSITDKKCKELCLYFFFPLPVGALVF